MENLFGEILRAALSDEPTEDVERRIAEKVVEKKMEQDLDTDVTISCHHEKGTDGADIQVVGRGKGIITGMYNLIGAVTLQMAEGEKETAMKILTEVSKGAQYYINERGRA